MGIATTASNFALLSFKMQQIASFFHPQPVQPQ